MLYFSEEYKSVGTISSFYLYGSVFLSVSAVLPSVDDWLNCYLLYNFKWPCLRGLGEKVSRRSRCSCWDFQKHFLKLCSVLDVIFLLYYCLLHVNFLFLTVIVTNLKYCNTVNIPLMLVPVIWRLFMEKKFKHLFSCEVWVGRPYLMQCFTIFFFCDKHFKGETIFEF